ncbi:hypothetical protein GOP47_0001338 [Adiantum capillus-veneris]|uniref:Uncharacterized protein n=1 Tax=Adiantum capillus-veneris TaxID=13818 RepID=A0A9D4ZQM4_ADICA|nr:hypothetical protein GOP47_0001338 [Adiantum capillus-veneris]
MLTSLGYRRGSLDMLPPIVHQFDLHLFGVVAVHLPPVQVACRYHIGWPVLSSKNSTNSQGSNGMGETFIMTDDELNAFAKTMVKSCQQNENLRTLFLESVRSLTMSGLMHAAASTLLQEEACEQAQTLMDAWAEAKKQSDVAKSLPMNLLKAVNQLHEKRGDLSTKLASSEDSFGLTRLDEKTWKLKLPILPEPKPIVPKNLGENDIPVQKEFV